MNNAIWTHTVYLSPYDSDRLPVHCTAHEEGAWTVLRAVGCSLRAPGAAVARSDGGPWYHRDGSEALVWRRPPARDGGYRAPRYPAWIPDDRGLLCPVVVERGDLVGGALRVTDAPWPRSNAANGIPTRGRRPG